MNAQPEHDMTVNEWCHRRGYSRATFYRLRKQGKAPRVIGKDKAQRITVKADAEWEAAREAEAAAQQEAA